MFKIVRGVHRGKGVLQSQLSRTNLDLFRCKSESYRGFRFDWTKLLATGAFLGSAFTALYYYKTQREDIIQKKLYKSVGKPAIGGPFDLIDHTGKPCTSKDFLGKWILIYFGFTHCPDVCPEELEKIVKTVDLVEKKVGEGKLIPLFITVDPDRDSPQAIEKYIREFSPKIIGLTGDKRAIDSVTKRYRVYYSQGPKDRDEDYIVDHTIIMYLINPKGEFQEYFGQNKTAEEIASEIRTLMRFT